jgi:MtN3 and saliva related transmembrane protein
MLSMNATLIEWIGMSAAVLTTLSWLPQAVQTIRTRQTRDISLPAQVLLFAGLILWLAYGVLISSLPLIVANIVTAGLVAVILTMKIKNASSDRLPE